ncbi:MAG: glutamate-1-semialdehyde 2,1-aminomutase [Gammaproteobacteria bacterium]
MSQLTKSAGLFARSQQVTPGGVHSPVRAFQGVGGVPPFIESADGAWLTDVDGNRYLDFCMSWGPMILGHQNPAIAAAAKNAIDKGCSFGTAESRSLELAELITAALPWVEKLRFVNSGTEAVMSALRLARGVTGRDKIVKFAGCYHGHADSMLVKAGSGLAEMASPDSAGVPAGTAADTLVVPLDDIDAVAQVFARHGTDIAAIIIEPVPANNGLLIQREGFLEQVVSIARAAGALVIFDEVITGFRLAFGGAAEMFGIEPDLVTYGKIIGGGFPVGAYGGRAELLDTVAPNGPVYQAGTLSGNPVAMSAGLAALTQLQELNPYAELAERTSNLAQRMQSVGADGIRVQSCGSLFWTVCGDVQSDDGVVRTPVQIPADHKERFTATFNQLLAAGFYLAPSAFEVGFLSTAHSQDDLDSFVAALGQVTEHV